MERRCERTDHVFGGAGRPFTIFLCQSGTAAMAFAEGLFSATANSRFTRNIFDGQLGYPQNESEGAAP